MSLRCITIDDEPLALEKLRVFLARIPEVELVGEFGSCLEALPAIRAEQPELLFLDIQMELLTGIQFLEQVPLKPHVVIVSAYDQYALKGYELNVADYILKPYSFDRLLKAVEKVRSLMVKGQASLFSGANEFLFVKSDSRYIKIPFNDISYVEGMRDYLCIHAGGTKVLSTMTFSQLLRSVPASRFVRVHKTYVVNLGHVDQVEKNEVWIGAQAIPIGPSYREDLYRRLEGHAPT